LHCLPLFTALVTCFTLVGIFSVIGTGYCVYRVRKRKQAANNVDYPAYGICGPQIKPTSDASAPEPPTGDRKLAQLAQMYHYHHQKQQMIATDK